jgi:hypothetical protein
VSCPFFRTHGFGSRGADRARVGPKPSPSENGGRRRPGAGCTRGLVCKGRSTRVSHHRFNRSDPAFPAQWCCGLYVISPVSGLDSHRRFAGNAPRNLIPASGDQDHTILPSACGIIRHVMPWRPSHPAPTFVTTRTPLLEGTGRANNTPDFNFGKREIFRPRLLNWPIKLKGLTKLVFWRRRFRGQNARCEAFLRGGRSPSPRNRGVSRHPSLCKAFRPTLRSCPENCWRAAAR